MTRILDDPILRTPAMMYLFHRVEQRLDGTPAIIVVDEGWKALDDDVFTSRIRDWEKTIRKRNGIVGFATQSAGDALSSRIASAIVEQAATQIFMANPKAQARDYVGGFGLTQHEYELVRSLPDSAHAFLIKHGHESVVARLDLSGDKDLADHPVGPRAHGAQARRIARRAWATSRATGCRKFWTRRNDRHLRRPRHVAGRRVPAVGHISNCQARALGENGFQALAGGAMGTAILSALVTVFVALIGYRLLLGHVPDARDGVGWAVRLGIVLALVTSWPAFQALVYRVAVDAPPDIAAVLLPASGLAGESLDERVQQAYDTMRLGLGEQPPPRRPRQAGQPANAAQQAPPILEPLPKTASLLVISTAGLVGALRIAIGFLLAVAPLAIMSLLFRGTNGLFIGWVRALAGAALGLVGATVVTAIHLVAVESELAHLAAIGGGEASVTVDPQALTTVVSFFALVAVVDDAGGDAHGQRAQAAAPAYVDFQPSLAAPRSSAPRRSPPRSPRRSRASRCAAPPGPRRMRARRRSPKC